MPSSSISVSAILPCYNHQQFLEQRIDSVLSQEHELREIIFLDDASTDDSVALARRYLRKAPCPVYFHSNQENSQSAFLQWNRGVRMATGQCVWIAETDDACAPSMIKQLVARFAKQGVVLAYCQSRYIDNNGNITGSPRSFTDSYWPFVFANDFLIDGSDFNRNFLSKANVIPNASAVLFDRLAYLSAGLANTSMATCGDWEMWIRLAEMGEIAYVSEYLNLFRRPQYGSCASGFTSKMKAEFLACRLRASLSHSETPVIPRFNIFLLRLRPISCVLGFSFLFSFINYEEFFAVKSYYDKLSNVILVGRSAWLLILVSSCLRFVLAIVISLASSFSSHLQRYVSRLSWWSYLCD